MSCRKSIIVMLFTIHVLVQTQHCSEISATEDLMREHGVLSRILLIYEDVVSKMEQGQFPVNALSQATTIMQDFIENYHEKLEENYLFPLFEKNNREVALIKTLRKQHNKGRNITATLKTIMQFNKLSDNKTQKLVISLLKKFVKMYRPHQAREDTVLFPQVRSLLSEKEFEQLGDTFEDFEQHRFGKDGFSAVVARVENIEKELSLYRLDQYTPRV